MTALTQCPVGGCRAKPEPVFCLEHWAAIDSETRRAKIVGEWKALTARRLEQPTPRFLRLVYAAADRVRLTSPAHADTVKTD